MQTHKSTSWSRLLLRSKCWDMGYITAITIKNNCTRVVHLIIEAKICLPAMLNHWLTVTGLSQATVAYCEQTTPSKWIYHLNLACIWISRLNSEPIRSCMTPNNLHTSSILPQGLHVLSLSRRMGTHHHAPVKSLFCSCIPALAILCILFLST